MVILIDMERLFMVTEVNAVQFRQNLGEMPNQVQYRNDSIVIKRDGKPVAALIDAALFDRIRRMQDSFDEVSARIAKAYADVPEEEVMAEIDGLVAKERSRWEPDCEECWTPTSWFPEWPIQLASLDRFSKPGVSAGLSPFCPNVFWMN